MRIVARELALRYYFKNLAKLIYILANVFLICISIIFLTCGNDTVERTSKFLSNVCQNFSIMIS